VPEGVQLPFRLAQWNIYYYNLDHHADPNWAEVASLIETRHFDLVVLIHYFGQPRDAKRMLRLLPSDSGLVEDWAHSYPHPHWVPPPNGHWALFSPTKIIGTTDGAWLIGPTSITPPHASNKQHLAYLFWQFLYLSGSTAQQLNLPGRQWWKRLSGGAYARAYQHLLTGTSTPKAMSKIGKWLTLHTPHNKIIRQRQVQAEYYYQHLNQTQVRFLVKKIDQQQPLIGFPLWVEDTQRFSAYLQAHGIRGQSFTDRWWFISEAGTGQYQSSKDLMVHHFLLPLHFRYTEEDLAYIVGVVNKYKG
jgi:dTDP-4-amino-4,6-dideoxygalactose transaminase